ncbi:hypothetical protein CEP54_013534 [Fusarium duplospermum]|uniref:Uncharacterized protein n=1 Tax=Fusarium duplospermum TaxID=1325734 RepID=A0A428P293_9HYPO|nr:hypothetical protein CEP54_013534 [Fusarium duplospermum]
MALPSPLANSTTDMALPPTPSADGVADEQPMWEFEDWFDGEYLDQLISDHLHPEGQELVDEVMRQVEQLSLASNLAQEVAGVDEQSILAERDEKPSGERQGDDHHMPGICNYVIDEVKGVTMASYVD